MLNYCYNFIIKSRPTNQSPAEPNKNQSGVPTNSGSMLNKTMLSEHSELASFLYEENCLKDYILADSYQEFELKKRAGGHQLKQDGCVQD